MKETTSLVLLFLFGCIGLFVVYGHQKSGAVTFTDMPSHATSKCIQHVHYYPNDQHCIEVILSNRSQNLWLDFGDGIKEYCTEEKAVFRYENPGYYTIRAYQNNTLIDIEQLDATLY